MLFSMDSSDARRRSLIFGRGIRELNFRWVFMLLAAMFVFFTVMKMGSPYDLLGIDREFSREDVSSSNAALGDDGGIRQDKFLMVPQLVWGLNNQKIAFARACLTARFLNRTILMPSFSASLFFKEIDRLEPMDFDKIFSYDKFNSICSGFVHIGRSSSFSNRTQTILLKKGDGRRWTVQKDMAQLKRYKYGPFDDNEVIKIEGKNPFLWHDHWPVKDYARIFECLVLVDEIASEAAKVVSKLRQVHDSVVRSEIHRGGEFSSYMAVHMRVEKDWMIHCKKREQRLNISEICSSKEEVAERVAAIKHHLGLPTIVYVAIADDLLEDSTKFSGWRDGLLPFDKKKLGVWDIYRKHSYLIQSAIDYDVCLMADVFVGNSFSTFSSLIVLERTRKLMKSSLLAPCDIEPVNLRGVSFAYNILGEHGGPKKWMTNMSESSLYSISYGTNVLPC